MTPHSAAWSVLALALLLAAPNVGWANAGDLDPSFGKGGTVTTAFGPTSDGASALALQGDGKIVAAGSTYTGTQYLFGLVRYNTDGSLDPAFGTGGMVTTEFGVGHVL